MSFATSYDEPDECFICYFKIAKERTDGTTEWPETLECGHIFGDICLDDWWAQGRSTCPYCRANVAREGCGGHSDSDEDNDEDEVASEDGEDAVDESESEWEGDVAEEPGEWIETWNGGGGDDADIPMSDGEEITQERSSIDSDLRGFLNTVEHEDDMDIGGTPRQTQFDTSERSDYQQHAEGTSDDAGTNEDSDENGEGDEDDRGKK